MELSDAEIERYSRQIVMDEIGFEGQQKLKNARVTVIGIGGLGSPITQQLVAMGIGKIRIVDRDVVEVSNLHRQVLYGDEDVGLSKAEAAYERLKRINYELQSQVSQKLFTDKMNRIGKSEIPNIAKDIMNRKIDPLSAVEKIIGE